MLPFLTLQIMWDNPADVEVEATTGLFRFKSRWGPGFNLGYLKRIISVVSGLESSRCSHIFIHFRDVWIPKFRGASILVHFGCSHRRTLRREACQRMRRQEKREHETHQMTVPIGNSSSFSDPIFWGSMLDVGATDKSMFSLPLRSRWSASWWIRAPLENGPLRVCQVWSSDRWNSMRCQRSLFHWNLLFWYLLIFGSFKPPKNFFKSFGVWKLKSSSHNHGRWWAVDPERYHGDPILAISIDGWPSGTGQPLDQVPREGEHGEGMLLGTEVRCWGLNDGW